MKIEEDIEIGTSGHVKASRHGFTVLDGNDNNILNELMYDIPLSPGSSVERVQRKKKRQSSISLGARPLFQYHTS